MFLCLRNPPVDESAPAKRYDRGEKLTHPGQERRKRQRIVTIALHAGTSALTLRRPGKL